MNMREIITYVAYDEEEFDSRKDCEDYENRHLQYMKEAERIYSFYDDKMKEINFHTDTNDMEQTLSLFYKCWGACEYIRVREENSRQLDELIYNYLGIDIPEQVGLWEYIGSGWKKVDE